MSPYDLSPTQPAVVNNYGQSLINRKKQIYSTLEQPKTNRIGRLVGWFGFLIL